MDYKKILNHIYSLESSKIKLGLKNIKVLLEKIGNPQEELKCIHVAGTNGKGSVCSMIFHVLKEAGYKVGLYTSPHLKKFNERIRINDKFIKDKEIVEYFLKIRPKITNQSFFEITTAMAFLYFKDKNVDFVVLEVGLGGRLDATNVVIPLICVITNIDLEHTDILGNTIEKIAYEKSGIIKKNIPIVTAAKKKALNEIKKIAKQRNAPLCLPKRYPKVKFNHLLGNFQQENKDIALTTIEILQKFNKLKISKNQILNGIKKTKWNARLQFIYKNVLIDCAHNPQGIRMLINELKNFSYKKLILVLGFTQDKDIKQMINLIEKKADLIILTKSNNKRAANPNEISKLFKNKPKIIKNPKNALKYARRIANKNDLILVTGSIYMIGEII